MEINRFRVGRQDEILRDKGTRRLRVLSSTGQGESLESIRLGGDHRCRGPHQDVSRDGAGGTIRSLRSRRSWSLTAETARATVRSTTSSGYFYYPLPCRLAIPSSRDHLRSPAQFVAA